MYSVGNLLKIKGDDVFWVSPDTTTTEALNLMAVKGVGALLVLEDGKLAGIVSERDFVRQIARKGSCELKAPVKEFMTDVVYYVAPTSTIDECMALMTEKRIRHLPVLKDGHVMGVISIGDVVKQVIASQQSLVDGLQNYITGSGYMR
jgi:CBS domain-containing protein